MSKNNRRAAALKAARTMKARREFVKQFSADTLDALVNIVANRQPWLDSEARSLAAYKANLTRGTYVDFVTVGPSGSITRDRLGLSRLV